MSSINAQQWIYGRQEQRKREREQERTWRGRRGDCLIEMYHYTVICVIYCATIEQQRRGFGSRPCARPHTQTHTPTYTLCLQWGSNRGCECISRYSPSVKCWPGVCEIDDSQAAPKSHMHTHIDTQHTAQWHIAWGQGVIHKQLSVSNTH